MNIRKNDILEIKITDMTTEGMGVGKAEGFAFFVTGSVPGDEIKMRVVKLKKNYGYGIIEEIIIPSSKRIAAPCPISKSCGGCSLQHLDYKAQLEFKQNHVKNTLIRIGGLPSNIEVAPTVGMDDPFAYRNKGQYPIGFKNGKTVAGFYAMRSHNIIPLSGKCLINQPTDKIILKAITDFADRFQIPTYNEETGDGILRHVLIRTAVKTNEIMVCIVINSNDIPNKNELIQSLKGLGIVTTAVLNINKKRTNVILGNENKILFGKGYMIDKIEDLSFKISPLSFFQVNPIQTEKLYKKALELADLSGTETVFDAYCGIGTISLFLAKRAKEVHAVEIVSDAISDANFNAKLNNIDNVHFYTGAAEAIYPALCKNGITPDTVIVDPPRKGCDPTLLDLLLNIAPNKIVYISCNPSTLARDLAHLTTHYTPTHITPFDMFPQTPHIETAVLLKRK